MRGVIEGKTARMAGHEADVEQAPLVLLVDDEPGLLKLFSSLIDRLQCRQLAALSGDEAIELLEQHTPDLLILDLAMPVVSGIDVLRHVRRVPRLSAMKVIILTARPNLVPEVEELGIDFWIAKPIMPHDFLAIVDEVLGDVRGER